MGSPQVGLVFSLGLVVGFITSFLVMTYGDYYTVEFQMQSSTKAKNPTSHEEVDQENLEYFQSTRRAENYIVDDHKHNDDAGKANELFDNVRVLVWVMTQPSNLQTKAIHVNNTWGMRANKILFASDQYDSKFPTLPITIPRGRDHLTAKTMAAFDYVYKHHLNDYDWFMKADDDTYVIMENLRYFLSNENKDEPVYFGHWFKTIVAQGYYSGGGGYVLSREALRRFGERGQNVCAHDSGAEDVEMGHCMQKLGVHTKESVDNLGRSRFHCFNPETHRRGGYPDWYLQYDKYGGSMKGVDGMSDYPITFHYCSVEVMYDMEYYVYHLRPYGIHSGLQDLNIHQSNQQNIPEIKPEVAENQKKPSDTSDKKVLELNPATGNKKLTTVRKLRLLNPGETS